MRQKATHCGELEASLHLLKIQKDAAAAQAEAADNEAEEIESREKRSKPFVPGKPFSPFERTIHYVQQHSAFFDREPPPLTHMPLDFRH